MIYTKLALRNYRKFQEQEIYFGEGINVILGLNEAGKSTISNALLDVLYTDPTSKAKELFNRIISWNNPQKMPYLELHLEDEGVEYTIIKDFAKREAKFINNTTGKETTNFAEITKIIAQLTGFPSKDVFVNTGFVSHSDIAKIEKKRDFINALQNVVNESKEDVNIQNIIFMLDKEIRALRIGLDRDVKEPGPIKLTRDRINYLQDEISKAQQILARVNSAHEQGLSAQSEQQQIEKEIASIEQLIKNYSIYENASKRLQEIESNLKQYQALISKYEELILQKNTINKELENYSEYTNKDVDNSAFQLNNHVEMRKIANTELSRYPLLDDADTPHYNNSILIDFLYYFLVLVLSIATYLLTSSMAIFVFVIIFGMTALSIFLYFFRQGKRSSIKQQRELLQQTVEGWKQKIRESTDRINAILDEYNCDSMGMFYTNKARYGVLKENLRENEIKINTLLNGKNVDRYRELQLNLLTEKKQIEVNELTDEVRRSKISGQEYLMQNNRLIELRNELQKVIREKTTAEVRQEESPINRENLIEFEEELEQQQKLLKNLEKRSQELSLIREAIEQSLEKTAASIDQLIKKDVEKYLPQITNNRYGKVKFNQDFDISIFSDVKKDWVDPVENLSRGTVDQIYFLTRVSFMRSILKDKNSPLILDDPFVSFDLERLNNTQEVLRDISSNMQVIIFTCTDEYADWGRVNFLK